MNPPSLFVRASAFCSAGPIPSFSLNMSALSWIVAAVLALTIPAVLWILPTRQLSRFQDLSEKDRAELENEYRRTLLQTVGGAVVLAGLYLTWREVHDSWDARLTDRLSTAVEHLADSSVTVRMGGIHALERIALDSRNSHDQYVVMDILSSFVSERRLDTPRDEDQPHLRKRLPADVRQAFVVLGRPVLRFSRIKRDLHEVDMHGAHVSRSDFSNAYLEYGDLSQADLREVRLVGTRLNYADFRGADVQAVDFSDACLFGADLRFTQNLASAKGLTREQLGLATLDKNGEALLARLPSGSTGCDDDMNPVPKPRNLEQVTIDSIATRDTL